MISSPTEKGVVIIGGWKESVTCNKFNKSEHSSDLLELSGDSKETLEWKFLERNLKQNLLLKCFNIFHECTT